MMIINEEKKVIVKENSYLDDIKNTNEMCALLMKTPHYAKMKAEGIFAIIQTAKSLNIDPIQALQGGLGIINGKVEMSARMMASLIRSKKHSITRDNKSNDEICILHGKRVDTKDCWTESFSIDEAKKAGIYRNVWITYPRDMLYARALSRLARQLFPDIIGNSYVEGEIKDDPNIINNGSTTPHEAVYVNGKLVSINCESQSQETIAKNPTKEQISDLMALFNEVPEYREEIEAFLLKKDIDSFDEMPMEMYTKVLARAEEKAGELLIDVEEVENENN